MNIWLRADASPYIGTGHVMRCLTLARIFIQQGHGCHFGVSEATLEVVPEMQSGVIPYTVMPGGDISVLGAASKSCDWLVVDHYGLDASFETACRQWAHKILVIDDLADRSHDCDLLLDQTLGRRPSDYTELVPSSAGMLLGPEFALLRREFARARDRALSRRGKGEGVRRILISLGGVAPIEVLVKILQGVAAADTGADIDVITGLSASGREQLENRIVGLDVSVTIHQGVEDMAEFMASSDLAIGAAGTTSWERCCLGLPTLLLILADNQRLIARNLTEAKAAISLGWWQDLTVEGISDAVTSVCSEDTLLTELSDNAASICDGYGAMRVYERMMALS